MPQTALFARSGGNPAAHDALVTAIANPARNPANSVRDRFRHPFETLTFFEIAPDQTVIEFIPGGGWYSEILAPLLQRKGHYVALVQDIPKVVESARKIVDKNRPGFARSEIATIDIASGTHTVKPGSADRVLTFRNVHNLQISGESAALRTFEAFYAMLKPGGILGVVDHRLPETFDSAREKTSGYIKRSTVIRLATAAGFALAGESEINANPKDTADWPAGVWTLPPTLRLGDKDRERYIAIGESDRMTLKFVKPRK